APTAPGGSRAASASRQPCPALSRWRPRPCGSGRAPGPLALPSRHLAGSEVPDQVHALVEVSDQVAVAVEHQGVTAPELAYAPLGGLTPARVVDVGVHVGVEPVLVRRVDVPGRRRLLGSERDLDYRLD